MGRRPKGRLHYCRYGCDAEEELGNSQGLNHIR